MAKLLEESLARADRFTTELSHAEPAMRAQLLGAWKELIIEQCVALLRSTDDVGSISNVDRAIALSMDIEMQERSRSERNEL